MTDNAWDPEQYLKFENERSAPFYDLLSLIHPSDHMNIVDLGCGTGALTRKVHDHFKAFRTLGIDSSPEMLKEALTYQDNHLSFEQSKIEDFNPIEKFDLIISNAALQWVPNHGKIFPKLYEFLKEDGQLAIQMPANFDYPTHTIANELANEAPFQKFVAGGVKRPVLSIEEYANLLFRLGFKNQIVRSQIYAHTMDTTDVLIEWVKGSLLIYFKNRLPNDLYLEFLKEYKNRLLGTVGWASPFFFPMKRILIWGKKG